MAHGVRQPQVGIAESQTGQRGGDAHLLARFHVIAIAVGALQIVKGQLSRLETETVREIVGPSGGVPLDSVRECIQPGVGRHARRQRQRKRRVNDGQRGDQFAAARAEFAFFLGVGQHQCPRHLAAGAACGGDGDHLSLGQAQRLHGIDVGRVEVGPFVERPDCLGGVERAAAPQADDPVRSKLACHCGPTPDSLQAWLRLHLGKDACLKPYVVQYALNATGDPQARQGSVRHNQRARPLNMMQMAQRIFTIHHHGRRKVPHNTPLLTIESSL